MNKKWCSRPPRVSVIIPSFNRKTFLLHCLDQLVRQTYRDFEVIVVDDGSEDGTDAALEEFAAQHPEFMLRWLVNPGNCGANASRNRAVRESSSEWIAMLDSDCLPDYSWLERMSVAFNEDQTASITGRIIDRTPSNIYELTLKGACRVHGRKKAGRLVAGNLAVRRDLLLKYPFDEDLGYGCDEEGLFLRLRSTRFGQRLVPDALVVHDHPYDWPTFRKAASISGKAAAWLVYKYRLTTRIDLLPFILGYASLLLGLINTRMFFIPLVLFMMAIAGLGYNELVRKSKTIGEAVRTFPLLLVYYHLRLWAYLRESLRLRVCPNSIQRVDLNQTEPNA